jgi:molybdopterin-guanine dinucleotide biosynthesis protein A
MKFSGAVLTGGRSTRMGRDKALVDVDGRPLAAIARDALVGAGATEVLAIGGDPVELANLGFRVVADGWPGEGPLGAVVTALSAADEAVVVVLACDLPDVVPATVSAVLAGLGDADVGVPRVDGRFEVLVAAYRRVCLDSLAASRAAGERSLRRAIVPLKVAIVELADPESVRNANRPADLGPGTLS